jgi:hypothetical protein
VNEFAYQLAHLAAGHLAQFDAVLTVPDAPTNNPSNLFFYWIGFQDQNNSMVVQNLLIWNSGQHVWQVQDNVYPLIPGTNGTTADHAVTVHPGETLTMQISEISPGTYTAIFPGLTEGLTVHMPAPMVHAIVAAETALAQVDTLPQGVKFSDIHLLVEYAHNGNLYDAPIAWNGATDIPGVVAIVEGANVIGIHTAADTCIGLHGL